jgi:hypothetical protein
MTGSPSAEPAPGTGLPEIHPDVAVLGPLLGTWRGRGRGDYPTIDAFEYLEELTFSPAPKPFVTHVERTRSADDGAPLHTETGYWRVAGRDGADRHRVELVIAQPSGVVEVLEGTFDGTTAVLRSTSIGLTSTAKDVAAVERVYRVQGDQLRLSLAMAAVGEPMTTHLEATLARQTAGSAAG